MDILKPWLAATLEGELSEAIRHKENGTNIHGSIQKSQGLWYDDGSNLRIPSAQKGPVVQITKVSRHASSMNLTNHATAVLDLRGAHTSHTLGQHDTCQCFDNKSVFSTIR